MSTHTLELEKGERFGFGANWQRFLTRLNDKSISDARESLCRMLEVDSLAGKRFLDIGSGSGLFSLAARDLGATVHSFDYDPQSVACTRELRQRFFPDDPDWHVEEGSVLDDDYLRQLGEFDIVYSWGVLHHTGAMWKALENASQRVVDGGQLFIAIYNDQGGVSRRWRKVKKAYCSSPQPLRGAILGASLCYCWWKPCVKDLLRGKPFQTWREYDAGTSRGMSAWHDVVDWVGGYPFEVAKPGEIVDFHHARGFTLQRLVSVHSGGCNEYVFRRKRLQ